MGEKYPRMLVECPTLGRGRGLPPSKPENWPHQPTLQRRIAIQGPKKRNLGARTNSRKKQIPRGARVTRAGSG